MKKIKYHCDICGQEIKDINFKFGYSCVIYHYSKHGDSSYPYIDETFDELCSMCDAKLNIYSKELINKIKKLIDKTAPSKQNE